MTTATRWPIGELPKAHLHLHLDGSMRPTTLAELAERYGISAPMPTGYGSFAAFGATITAAASCLRTEADVRRLLLEITEDARDQGARWIEPSVWPGMLRGRLGSYETTVEILLDAARDAASKVGIGVGVILAANRDQGPAEAIDIARLAVRYANAGVVGFGLDGDESAHPPAPFADAFALVADTGLILAPHAGELAGPTSIRDAVSLLGANRLMHGVRAVEDPALLEDLIAAGVSLDVCPTSNVLLSVVPSLPEHPLPQLLAAGVKCSLNADDPLLFATDLATEYERCREDLDLTDAQLAELARTSFTSSAAPADLTTQALEDIDTWLTSRHV